MQRHTCTCVFFSILLSIWGIIRPLAISSLENRRLSFWEWLLSGSLLFKITKAAIDAVSNMSKKMSIGHRLIWRFAVIERAIRSKQSRKQGRSRGIPWNFLWARSFLPCRIPSSSLRVGDRGPVPHQPSLCTSALATRAHAVIVHVLMSLAHLLSSLPLLLVPFTNPQRWTGGGRRVTQQIQARRRTCDECFQIYRPTYHSAYLSVPIQTAEIQAGVDWHHKTSPCTCSAMADFLMNGRTQHMLNILLNEQKDVHVSWCRSMQQQFDTVISDCIWNILTDRFGIYWINILSRYSKC